jgi:thioredoxin reductase (NADPH)
MTRPAASGTRPPPKPPGAGPLLGESQLTVLRRYGTEHHVRDGEILFADGDKNCDMIILLEGEANIVEHFGQPDENVNVTYGPREFLGEMGLLTGQSVFVTAVATSEGRILRIPTVQLKIIMCEEPDLSELILRAFLLRRVRLTNLGGGLVLVGSRFDPETRRLISALARNRISSQWLQFEDSPEAESLLRELDVKVEQLPVVVIPGGSVLLNPTNLALLDALGMTDAPLRGRSEVCDLLVIGGGPAGLSAAIYGASEGLNTTLADGTALGGQAGTSSRIENYLGFPAGLSGDELTARAVLQAEKFGVRIKLGTSAVSLSSDNGSHHVHFDDEETVSAGSVIVATGARYNRLPLDRLSIFEGVGVYYAASQMEARACSGGQVAVVGGGNSAGQAALFLARTSLQVHILIRGATLESSMSRYLIDQIERHSDIHVLTRAKVAALLGDKKLEGITAENEETHDVSTLPICGLFVFIGAEPSTEWIGGQLAEDSHGFLLTGSDIPQSQLEETSHLPLTLETSRPGIFCIGDVRSRSVKRVAAAIGEGSAAVQLVFERIDATELEVSEPPNTERATQSPSDTSRSQSQIEPK